MEIWPLLHSILAALDPLTDKHVQPYEGAAGSDGACSCCDIHRWLALAQSISLAACIQHMQQEGHVMSQEQMMSCMAATCAAWPSHQSGSDLRVILLLLESSQIPKMNSALQMVLLPWHSRLCHSCRALASHPAARVRAAGELDSRM